MSKIDDVNEAIKSVMDPELMLSVVDLGLVYEVDLIENDEVATVKMTLTSPMCPMGPQIIAGVKAAAESIDGVNEARVELVWSPPWDPKEMATDEVKDILGIW
jgi:metal-sulfur cluster biosynthetic enzyme